MLPTALWPLKAFLSCVALVAYSKGTLTRSSHVPLVPRVSLSLLLSSATHMQSIIKLCRLALLCIFQTCPTSLLHGHSPEPGPTSPTQATVASQGSRASAGRLSENGLHHLTKPSMVKHPPTQEPHPFHVSGIEPQFRGTLVTASSVLLFPF